MAPVLVYELVDAESTKSGAFAAPYLKQTETLANIIE